MKNVLYINRNLKIIVILLSLFICSVTLVNAAGGGGAVPITTIELTEEGNDYSMTPGRLIFEFNEKWYAIQLRRVKDENASFMVMDLDEDNLEDITAYEIIEDEFYLYPNENRRIDLDGDDIEDGVINLDKIIKGGEYGTIRSASFSIRKLTNTNIIPTSEEDETIEELEEDKVETIENDNNSLNEESEEKINETQKEEILEDNKEVINKTEVINLTSSTIQEVKNESTNLTFFQKIINWFKNIFY